MTDLVPWQSNPDVLERVGRCNEIYRNLLTVNRAFLSRLLDLLMEIHDLVGDADGFRDLVDSQLSWLAGRDVVAMVALWREARKERAIRELATLQPDATISLFAGVPADTDTERLLSLLQMPPGERRRALAGAPAQEDAESDAGAPGAARGTSLRSPTGSLRLSRRRRPSSRRCRRSWRRTRATVSTGAAVTTRWRRWTGPWPPLIPSARCCWRAPAMTTSNARAQSNRGGHVIR